MTAHSGRIGLASELASRGAPTTAVMLAVKRWAITFSGTAFAVFRNNLSKTEPA